MPSLTNVLAEAWTGVQVAWAWALGQLGVSWWVLALAIVALLLFRTFFGGSGKGRGRRYRRGFRVAYTEERGKLAARRAERHKDEQDATH